MQCLTANFSAFEIDDEELPNLREFALANAVYWVGSKPFSRWITYKPG